MLRRFVALPFFFFCFMTLAFHFDKLIDGKYTSICLHDEFDHEYPRYEKTGELFYAHGFYGWYPALAGGSPSYAYQFPPYYPMCLMAPIFPLWFLYSAFMMVWMCLSGFGMYLFLKKRMLLEKNVALAGGFVFAIGSAISGASVTQVDFNYCFPLFYCLATHHSDRKWVLWASGCGLCLLAVFSYPVLTVTFYVLLHFMVMFIIDRRRDLGIVKIHFQRWVIYWTGYVLSFAPLIYTLFVNRNIAARDYSSPSSPFITALGVILWKCVPQMMLIFLLGGSVLLITKSQKVRNVFLMSSILATLTAFFNSTAMSFAANTLLMKMDLLSLHFTLPFALTVAGFIGLDEAIKHTKLQRLFLIGGLMATILTIGRMEEPFNLLNYLVAALCLILILRKTPKLDFVRHLKWVAMAAILLIGRQVRRDKYEIIRFNQIFGYDSTLRKLIPSDPPQRIATFFMAFIRVAGISHAESAVGRSPFFLKTYKDFIKLIVQKQLVTEKDRSDFVYPYDLVLFNGILREESYVQRDMDLCLNYPLLLSANITQMLVPRFLSQLAGRSKSVIQILAKHDHPNDGSPCTEKCLPFTYYLYNLKDAFPRAYMVNNVSLFNSEDALLNSLSNQSIATLRDTVFMLHEQNPPLLNSTGKAVGQSVNIRSYSPDKIVIEVDKNSPAYLVISNNYHKNWTAKINGTTAPIYRANHTFQAVWIEPKGRSEVVLEYKDPMLWVLHLFVPVGLSLMFITPFFPGKRKYLSG